MLRCFVTFGNLNKEVQYINQQHKKGLVLTNKWGPFFSFKKEKRVPETLCIELAPKEMTFDLNDSSQILEKRVSLSALKKIYYQFDEPITADEGIMADSALLLAYYRLNLNKYRAVLYAICFALILLMGVNAYVNEGLYSSPIYLVLFLIGVIFTLVYFAVTKKTRQLIKKYATLENDFDDEIRTRFIVQIGKTSEEEVAALKENFGYLGIWQFRFIKDGTAYFYLMSKSNEVLIKEELEQVLGDSRNISVVSPFYLFPIGYM